MDEQLGHRLSSLSAVKRRLVLRRLLDGGYAVEALPICRVPADTPNEASTFEAQDRLLLLETLRPGTMYNRISLALQLRGSLRHDCLHLALRDLGARHQGLRTRFVLREGIWHQVVLDRSDIDLPVLDLSGVVASAQDLEIERQRDRFDQAPIDPESGLPWRTALLRLGEQSHVLLLCLHHVVADGWSVDVLATDLSQAYRARLSDVEPRWERPALQPRDYAQFWHDLRACGTLDDRRQTARQSAATSAGVTSIAADFVRPKHKNDRSGIVNKVLDPALLDALHAVHRRQAVSLAAIYAAVTLIALREFAGETELLVAVALANREHAETQDLVAPLVDVRPFRIDIDDGETLCGLASRVQGDLARLASGRTTHTDGPGGTDATPAVPRCLLIVQNTRRLRLDLPDIEVEVLAQRRAGALYELTIVFHSLPDGCRVSVEYDNDLYTADTAAQFVERLVGLMRAVTIDAAKPIAIATRPGRDEAFGFLPAGPHAADVGLSPPIRLILEQAAARPDAIAIDAETGRTSYAELVERAANLAAALPRGTGDHRPVAVMTADGARAALAMLASHLARLPFTMLDPHSPPARNAQIVNACRAGAIVFDDTNATAANKVSRDGNITMVALADLAGARSPLQAPAAEPAADCGLAYVAFTSGSTGQPKGILQSQLAFSQFLQWQQEAFDISPQSRIAMWSSLTFDACYTEVFGALMAGATLCVPAPDRRRDPQYVINWLERAGVTYLLTVPSFLALLVNELAAGRHKLALLRDIAVSGEVLAPELCSRLQRLLPAVRLHNLFGPTEAVLACHHQLNVPYPDRLRVAIGRPIAGRRLLLTDQDGRPVARGAMGEINIVSRFLTEGYLIDGKIVPFPPFDDAEDSRQRIYRTGDYGRIGHDGDLQFLGRRDGLVKIRGVRIAIDEVESVLARHAEVGSCAVVDRDAPHGTRQLVAFIVPSPNGPVVHQPYEQAPRDLQVALRTQLMTSLDQHAVPAFFILAAQLPRTTTGKIDHLALRNVDPASVPSGASPTIAPERELAPDMVLRIRAAWKSVLSATQRDDDNFFDSGGDSIAAVRLHQALEQVCPGLFRLVDIYANPSIETTCEAIRLRGEEHAISDGAQRALRRKSARRAIAMRPRSGDDDA